MGRTALGFTPASQVAGTLVVPTSKSIAQRHVVLACIAFGRTELHGLSTALDVQAALAFAEQVASCERLPGGAWAITGRPPAAGGPRARAPIDVRESATLARLATAVLALCGASDTRPRVQGGGSLERRRSAPLFAALRAAGAQVHELGARGGWPVELEPLGPPSDLELVDPVSSQELSALLVALSAFPGHNRLLVRGAIPSAPYVALTRACVEHFGARIEVESDERGELHAVHGPLRAPQAPLAIEPDASAAAVALAAAALCDREARVDGLTADSAQGDLRFVEHARAFGCAAGSDERGTWIRGRPRQGARLDLSGEPDLAPVAAALAAAVALRAPERSSGTSLLVGLDTLRGKESDRIACLARGLASLGLSIGHGPDFLRIAPGPHSGAPGPRVLDASGDHRMAFAFGLLGLVERDVHVSGAESVAKSWPGFWRDLARAGARLATIELDE